MGVSVETESAGTYPNVTEDELHRLVSQMEPGNRYVILHLDGGRDGYGQAYLNDDGTYTVEYRGGPHDHWQAFSSDVGVVYEVLSGWAADRPGWRERLEWKILDLGF